VAIVSQLNRFQGYFNRSNPQQKAGKGRIPNFTLLEYGKSYMKKQWVQLVKGNKALLTTSILISAMWCSSKLGKIRKVGN
jgi:hypothetical protein